MPGEIKREEWVTYCNAFSKRNQTRPTRLEIFGELGAQEEERYLPFSGLSLEDSGADAPKLEIMLGGDTCHLTHTIQRVRHIWAKTGGGQDEALEIQAADGSKTLLRFETPLEMRA